MELHGVIGHLRPLTIPEKYTCLVTLFNSSRFKQFYLSIFSLFKSLRKWHRQSLKLWKWPDKGGLLTKDGVVLVTVSLWLLYFWSGWFFTIYVFYIMFLGQKPRNATKFGLVTKKFFLDRCNEVSIYFFWNLFWPVTCWSCNIWWHGYRFINSPSA